MNGYASSINDDGVIVGINGSELFLLTPSEDDCSDCDDSLPDLDITMEEGTISEISFVLASVLNAGTETVDEATVELFANPSVAPELGEQSNQFYTLSNLQAGQTHYDITQAVSGTNYAIVDSLDLVEESDESNNVTSVSID